MLDSNAHTRVVYKTLASALTCEVADTPTGVVMNGYRVIRTEQDSTAWKHKEESSWLKPK